MVEDTIEAGVASGPANPRQHNREQLEIQWQSTKVF
jgi:hypothetical protein